MAKAGIINSSADVVPSPVTIKRVCVGAYFGVRGYKEDRQKRA
jgi:hypothetical protein